MSHTEGIEQVLLKHRIPSGCARGLRHDAARQEMCDVGVGEGRAEAGYRLDIAQRADERRVVEVVHGKHVVGEAWKAGALSKQVEDAKLARHPRILQLELRIEVDNAIVPPQLAAIDHDGLGRGEERLGGRADLEQSARVDRSPAALAAYAEALGID
jgi:hypothetical protein